MDFCTTFAKGHCAAKAKQFLGYPPLKPLSPLKLAALGARIEQTNNKQTIDAPKQINLLSPLRFKPRYVCWVVIQRLSYKQRPAEALWRASRLG